jgi:hypothetical protein
MFDTNKVRLAFAIVSGIMTGAGALEYYHATTQPLSPLPQTITLKLSGSDAIDDINKKVAAGDNISSAQVRQLVAYNQSVNDTKQGLAIVFAGAFGLSFIGATAGRRSNRPVVKEALNI